MKQRPELTEQEAIDIAEKIRDEMIYTMTPTPDICVKFGWSEGEFHWMKRKYPAIQPIISDGIKTRNDTSMSRIADKADDLINYIEQPSFKNRLDALKLAIQERKWYSTHFDKTWVNKDAGVENGGPLQVIIRKFSDTDNDSE